MPDCITGHPKLHQLNHYMELICTELIQGWKGLRFTRTYDYPHGRDLQLALGLIIADMLAARALMGVSSATSRQFCIQCPITFDCLDDLDVDSWGSRDWEDFKFQANEWLNATSTKERNDLFNQNQVRYSPLCCLSYFNGIQYCVGDAMHFDRLNNAPFLIRHTWRISLDHQATDGSSRVLTDRARPEDVEKATRYLNKVDAEGVTAVVQAISTTALSTICYDNGLRFNAQRAALINAIYQRKLMVGWSLFSNRDNALMDCCRLLTLRFVLILMREGIDLLSTPLTFVRPGQIY